MGIVERVRKAIEEHEMLSSGETLVVGVSGGPDSLCLLHVLRELAPRMGISLQVGHLEHGIRGDESLADARSVESLCAVWGLPCTVERRDVPALAKRQGRSLEEAARQARYRFLGGLARSLSSQTVAVAHNADDQAETVLMHFLRGSGLAGLRGMLPVSPMEQLSQRDGSAPRPGIRLLRPLLAVPRSDIEAYCRDQGLQPRLDRSNLDTTLFRNRLRHELMPALETYNPRIRQVLQRTASVVAADLKVLQDLANDVWRQVVLEASADAIVYDLEAMRSLKLGLQRALLRKGVRHLRASLRNLDWVHIEHAIEVLERGHVGSRATLPARLVLSLGYRRATLAHAEYVAPKNDAPRIGECLELALPGTTCLPDSPWCVEAQVVALSELPDSWPINRDPYLAYFGAERVDGALWLRPRRAGDQFVPLGMEGHQTVRAFMINARVPAAERDRVPLLTVGSEIAWVVGWRIAGRFALSPETTQVISIRFSKRSSRS